MKEFKIGEKVILEVVETETPTCIGCFFDSEDFCKFWTKYPCVAEQRSDGKNVIFKQVETV